MAFRSWARPRSTKWPSSFLVSQVRKISSAVHYEGLEIRGVGRPEKLRTFHQPNRFEAGSFANVDKKIDEVRENLSHAQEKGGT